VGRFDIVSSWEPFTLMIKIDDMTGDGANSQTMIVVNLWQKAPDALIYSDMTPFRAFTDESLSIGAGADGVGRGRAGEEKADSQRRGVK